LVRNASEGELPRWVRFADALFAIRTSLASLCSFRPDPGAIWVRFVVSSPRVSSRLGSPCRVRRRSRRSLGSLRGLAPRRLDWVRFVGTGGMVSEGRARGLGGGLTRVGDALHCMLRRRPRRSIFVAHDRLVLVPHAWRRPEHGRMPPGWRPDLPWEGQGVGKRIRPCPRSISSSASRAVR
jgi:hypothetical protein